MLAKSLGYEFRNEDVRRVGGWKALPPAHASGRASSGSYFLGGGGMPASTAFLIGLMV